MRTDPFPPVHDLNATPELPFPDESFDAVVNAVSIQYLTRPVEVFASAHRVLRPGGIHIVATSHRLFPTKAVAVWQAIEPATRTEGSGPVLRRLRAALG